MPAKNAKSAKTAKTAKPPWKRKNPRKAAKRAPKMLTPAKKAVARSRAKKAGRHYPNLVDNMWAASGRSSKTKSVKTKSGKPEAQ